MQRPMLQLMRGRTIKHTQTITTSHHTPRARTAHYYSHKQKINVRKKLKQLISDNRLASIAIFRAQNEYYKHYKGGG